MSSYSFGSFILNARQRSLVKSGEPIRIGDRALELLLALVEHAGDVVEKRDLIDRAWPGIHVGESSLKGGISALRRALEDQGTSPQYVVAVAGNGYRFVHPVQVNDSKTVERTHRNRPKRDNLPHVVARIFGRTDCIAGVRKFTRSDQLVTIVGGGGIGETTVALAVARLSLEDYPDGVWFVDLAPLSDPQFLAAAIATSVGSSIHADRSDLALRAFLQARTMLIILDNCEHVRLELAELLTKTMLHAKGVRILATSREPLCVDDERVYWLDPLSAPSTDMALRFDDAMTFPAVQLFVERAREGNGRFSFSNEEVADVAGICRDLDGNALAIELAASRAPSLGVKAIAGLLKDRFRLLNRGSRTAPERQKTLHATLDWSFRLLTDTERLVLRRLSLFSGPFNLEGAAMVAALSLGVEKVSQIIGALVAKSLISRDKIGHYRLLETTRAYTRQKLDESGDTTECSRRHAEYMIKALDEAEAELEERSIAAWKVVHSRTIDDVRTALEWSFGRSGEPRLGVALVVGAMPLWARLSLLGECRVWAERALSDFGKKAMRNETDSMKISTTLASVLLYTTGPTPQIGVLCKKALSIAEKHGNLEYKLRALSGLAFYRLFIGDNSAAAKYAASLRRTAEQRNNVAFMIDGARLVAAMRHYMGGHSYARRRLTHLLDEKVVSGQGRRLARFHLDHRVSARCILSHALLIQGFYDQARDVARIALQDAQALGHSISIGNALVLAAGPVALHRGELDHADELLTLLNDDDAQHRLVVCLAACLRAVVMVERRDRAGLAALADAVDELRNGRIGVRYAYYSGLLAQATARAGRTTEAYRSIGKAISWAEKRDERWSLPELIRIKAEILCRDESEGSRRKAEIELTRAIGLARRQKASIWQLRATIDLACLWQHRNRRGEARELLSMVYGQFSEGFDTVDLRYACKILNSLKNGEITPASVIVPHKYN